VNDQKQHADAAKTVTALSPEKICRQGGGEKQTTGPKMKFMKHLLTAALLAALAVGSLSVSAADSDKKPKPYPLDKCIVSDEKLGEHGKPYVFTHEGQEIKMCCKDCLKDFKKEPAKYLKKIEEANKGKK
jgi:YHS domain-containing protein